MIELYFKALLLGMKVSIKVLNKMILKEKQFPRGNLFWKEYSSRCFLHIVTYEEA